jgi:hypothetical protein
MYGVNAVVFSVRQFDYHALAVPVTIDATLHGAGVRVSVRPVAVFAGHGMLKPSQLSQGASVEQSS